MTPFHPNPRHPSLELRPRCRSRIWSRCGPTALETRVHRIARERPHRRNSIPHTNRFRSWPDRHRFAIDYPRGSESDDPLGRGSSFDPSTFPVSASGTIAARPRPGVTGGTSIALIRCVSAITPTFEIGLARNRNLDLVKPRWTQVQRGLTFATSNGLHRTMTHDVKDAPKHRQLAHALRIRRCADRFGRADSREPAECPISLVTPVCCPF